MTLLQHPPLNVTFYLNSQQAIISKNNSQTDRETDYDGKGPHAGVRKGRIEAVATEILAKNCFHVNGELSQEKVEDPVVAPVSNLEFFWPYNFLNGDCSKKLARLTNSCS